MRRFCFLASILVLSMFGFGTVHAYPLNGLVMHLNFDGNANDASGLGNNGTVFGATFYTDRSGNASRSLLFDGINDFVEVQDSPSLRVHYATFAFWVNTNDASRTKIIGKSVYETAANEQYGMFLHDGYAGIGIKRNSNNVPGVGWNDLLTTDPIKSGAWTHIAGTWDGVSLRMYMDGILQSVSSNAPTGFIDDYAGGNLRIGSWWAGDPMFFHGLLDDVMIYNRALSDREIQEIASVTHVPEPATLLLLGSGLAGLGWARRKKQQILEERGMAGFRPS